MDDRDCFKRIFAANFTHDPTINPTHDPTHDPTMDLTGYPTTAEPGSATPTTANPTSAEPTPSDSEEMFDPSNDPTMDPTKDPLKHPTQDPTQDPTQMPSNRPTSAPSNGPTASPIYTNSSKAPTSSSNSPSTASSIPSKSPIDDPTYTYSPTNSPTDETNAPNISPTDDPSVSPSNNPTYDSTKIPSTVTNILCNAWSIEIQFTLRQYTTAMDEISKTLFSLSLRAFQRTLFNAWNDEWCITLPSVKFVVVSNSRRRNLLQTNDIECEALFEFNDALYKDYFSSGYNETKFASDYTMNMELVLNDTSTTVNNVQVDQPVQLLVTKESNNNAVNDLNIQIVALLLVIAVLWIVIASIYSKIISINDFYRVGALITVTIHINDTVSDALFCANVPQHSEYPSNNLFLIFNLSMIFLCEIIDNAVITNDNIENVIEAYTIAS